MLRRLYLERQGLFSGSARLSHGDVVNDPCHPGAIRHTINSLLGLQRARECGATDWPVEEHLHRLVAEHGTAIKNVGDRGLLLWLRAAVDLPDGHLLDSLAHIAADQPAIESLPLQDVCWLLLGLLHAAERWPGSAAEAGGESAWGALESTFFARDSLFPLHAAHGPRRRFVSFGGIVYFLLALHHVARVTGDAYPSVLFRELATQVIALQGPQGEWGWFYDAFKGILVERYELYTVHQAAMAPLVLLPAIERGVPQAAEAIERGLSWLNGNNELRTEMVLHNPFFTYRSLGRRGPYQRARRLLRAQLRSRFRRPAARAAAGTLEVNQECRSYEIGWLTYAWAGVNDFGDTVQRTFSREATHGANRAPRSN